MTATLPDGRKLVREVQAGSSYLSSEDPRVHFGLGEATRVAQLTIRFPDGTTTSLDERRRRPDRRRGLGLPAQRPERSCSRRATESSVTASSRMTPVTM